MLRLYDHRTGRAEPLPGGPGLRVQLAAAEGRRVLVVTDLLRRVAQRAGKRVRVASTAPLPGDCSDYNVAAFEVLDAPMPNADVHVFSGPGGSDPGRSGPGSGPGGSGAEGLVVTVPPETGDWASADPLAVRLAMLEVPYREPLDLSGEAVADATERLDGWRAAVAEWATAPGRPMSREHAAEAETALADDLGSPGALAVLDRLAYDADIPPGAKLETFIHLDMLLAVGLVSAIGGT
ncbi:hypothetical protein E1200_30485 [Actinomadura sp. GC306]|uniref:hypothetical protein n=1 Tax=Actinomadura sp. GC306 TaxID=2530367 RepID=UPI001051EB02|nr:hypothetical protein [Actinomadura sp. GC306]TDC60410.1 hypothetical protein E1200_30485 [Actinomadura sp. GC306]